MNDGRGLTHDRSLDESMISKKRDGVDGLCKLHVKAYSIGHLSNDLCAAVWFTYALYYFQEVAKLGHTISGLAMLSGQLADGITTPICGLLSDKYETRIGRRAPWYIVGTIIVLPSFLGIFLTPSFVSQSTSQIVYYITLPAIFNVGWAFVQVSNMALVNSITYNTERRDTLISLRNGFTFVANLSVLTIALFLFEHMSDQVLQFRVLALIVVTGGTISSLFYIMSLNEPKLVRRAKQM
jgi:Na+/melibiose symporter-like transporter